MRMIDWDDLATPVCKPVISGSSQQSKTRAEIIAYWRGLLVRPHIAEIARQYAKEAISNLVKQEEALSRASETGPITQADPTRGVDERS